MTTGGFDLPSCNQAGTLEVIFKELGDLLTKHAKDIRRVVRPAGMVENAKPLIIESGQLPRLRQYLGMRDFKAHEATRKPPVRRPPKSGNSG